MRAVLSIAALILIWEATSRLGPINISLFPPPSRVVLALREWFLSGELARDFGASMWRALAGLVLGGTVGALVGLATGRIGVARDYLAPIIQILRPLPPVAIIPLLIVWFGIGSGAKVLAIALAVFFPVWINAYLGARDVPQVFLWSAKSLRIGALRTLGSVVLPAALQLVVAGIRNGIALAFIMVYVTELAGASEGLGYQISVAQLSYRIDRMMAALVVLAGAAALADVLFAKVTSRAFPWLSHNR